VALVLLIVVCLATITFVVATRSAGDGLSERLRSLKNDEVPRSQTVAEREELLAVASEFVRRYYTYGSDMLDDDGNLSEYLTLTELMTPKFGQVFTEQVELVERTVRDLDAGSEAEVHAVGVASQDSDSANVLVAGTLVLSASYAQPGDEPGGEEGEAPADGEDPERVSSGPQAVRLRLSLVKIDGEWLVDDFDDIDDGQPPFSQPRTPEGELGPDLQPQTTPPEPSTTDGGEDEG